MSPSRPGIRVVVGAIAFLLPVLYSSSVSVPAWTPRAALLLFLVAAGLPRLPLLVRSAARAPALAAVAFLAVAAVATALSSHPGLAFFGLYSWGTGLVFVAALVAAWSLGAGADRRAVAVLELALLGGLAANVLVALVQGFALLDTGPFTRYEGRAAGLLGNPVHLGALCAAGLALLLPRARTRFLPWGAAVALTAAAVELSGSRFALGLALLLALAWVARGRRAALPAAAALGFGLLLGIAIGAAGGTTTGAGRVQAGGESVGVTARLHVWKSATHAIAARPVLGAGPGQFRAATSRYRDLALVRAEGPDRLFYDAHNLVVEYATTTGVVGVAALLTWLALAGRRASGPLLVFAVILLAMHLVEPQFIGTTPLAFLALGAAGRADVPAAPPALIGVGALLALAAAIGSGRLLWGDVEMARAQLSFSPTQARAAVRLLPHWPEPAEVAGKVVLFRALSAHHPADRRDALLWRRRAVARDDTDPVAWSQLGEAQGAFGLTARARASFQTALRWDPWSVRALDGLGATALALGDRAAARDAFQRSLRADPNQRTIKRKLGELSAPQTR